MIVFLPILELLEIFLYFVLIPLLFLGMISDGFLTFHQVILEKWAWIKVLLKNRVDFWREHANTAT